MDKIIKQKLYSGGACVFGGKILSFFCQIAIHAFMARLLSPEDMGLYFLIASLVNLSMLFSLLGMDRSIVRIVSESMALERPHRARQAVGLVLQIGFLSSLFVAAFLLSGPGRFLFEKIFDSEEIGGILYFPAIWVLLFTLQSLIAESFRGFNELKFATIFNGLLSSAISALMLGIVLWCHLMVNLRIVLSIIIISYAINLVFALLILLKQTSRLPKSVLLSVTRYDVIKNSLILYATNILFFVMNSGHLWLLAYYSTKDNVAIYGAVLRLMVLITTTLSLIRLTILPSIGHLYAQKRYGEVENLLRSTATIAGLPAIAGLLLILLFGKSILLLQYGDHYISGYPALVVLALANLVNVFTGTPAVLLVMASREKYLFFFSLFSSSIGIMLSFLLLRSMNYIGVAIGAGTGIVLNNVLMAWYCQRALSINTLMSFKEVSNFSFKMIKRYDFNLLSGGFKNLFK